LDNAREHSAKLAVAPDSVEPRLTNRCRQHQIFPYFAPLDFAKLDDFT
jgi:hypothetical protein